MKKLSKLLCLLLIVAMVFSFMSIGASALSAGSTDIGSILTGILNNPNATDAIGKLISGGLDKDEITDQLTGWLGSDEGAATIEQLLGTKFDPDTSKAIMDAAQNALQNGLSKDDISKALTDALENGTAADALSKLLPNSGINQDELLKQLSGILGGGNSDILAQLKNLLNGSSGLDKSQIDAVLAKLSSLVSGGVDTDTILKYLEGLLGGTNIGDDDTPKAGAMVLNSTDHLAYINGRSANIFAPNGTLTRAEAAQMLYNLLTAESMKAYHSTKSYFADVSSTSWYNECVSTLVAGAVIGGYPDGTFKPNNAITRAEFVKMIVAMYGEEAGAVSPFKDVARGSWYYEYVATAANLGWTQGYSDGTFRPNTNISRAEAVTFLNRVLGRVCDLNFVAANPGAIKTFSDVPYGSWFFEAVTEAANPHNYTKSTTGVETWTSVR